MASKVRGPVRVRFAPSPTGFLHVGGARTAIYNELLCQSLGGAHILRIEDTDKQRSDDAMTRQIIDALAWLGVQVDEGPYIQSERLAEHQAAAEKLIAQGDAYRCFRTAEELDAERKAVLGRGDSYRYKTSFSPPSAEETERRMAAGESSVVRFRMPEEAIVVEDFVHGDVTFPEESLDDFIILRSDGTPTYHLTVVIDDVHVGITHVIRGEDHLSNTPKHIGIYRALGEPLPAFGHLPLILGTDRKRLSKRTGSTSVEEFRDRGILPEALYNYLALLGWSPGDDREIMTRADMIEAFTAERLGKTHAVFDVEKLEWMNAMQLQRLDLDRVFEHLAPYLEEVGLKDVDAGRLRQAVDLHRMRVKTLPELAAGVVPYFRETLEYDLDLTKKFRKNPDMPALLEALKQRYAELPEYSIEATEAALRELAEEKDVKAGVLIHPTRIALSGSKAGPPLFDLVVVMGREEGQRHFGHFIEFVRQNPLEA